MTVRSARGRAAALLALALAVLGTPAPAQQGTGVLSGRVLDADSRAPLAGVVVQLRGTGRSVETDSAGAFRLEGLTPELASVRLFRIGYGPVERSITLYPNRVVTVEYVMQAEAARLPEVTVAGRPEVVEGPAIMAGFEERRRMGGGTFLDETQLRRYEARRMADVLRGAANLRFITDGNSVTVASNRQTIRSMRPGAQGPCYLDIILDGVLYWSQTRDGEARGDRAPNVNSIVPVAELGAIEIYPSTAAVPLKYRSIGNACGALMFWTKRGLAAEVPPAG